VLNRNFLTEDYLDATKDLGVVKTVYMEVAVDASQKLAEAQHVVTLCERTDNPTCAAVIGVHPDWENFRSYIGRFKDSPYVKGARCSFGKPEQCLRPEFIAGVRLLGELGMSFDLCGPPTGLSAAAKLVDRCPDTRFVLDHRGNISPSVVLRRDSPPAGEQWRRDLAALARRKNVICKISGIVARASKETWTADDLAPTVEHCLDVFGPDRIVFGGDWPVCTKVASLRQWITALRQIIASRPEEEQRKLLHDNAVRFYGLA